MAITHAIASGMGGMRTAGDLVARMQMTRGMKIQEAKAYVADRLGASVTDLTDPVLMGEAREDLKLGVLHPRGGSPKCMEAKFNIARLLDIDINCVRRFRENASL
jgi:dimethylamine--corrinoid protein Co-methyltransferase